MSYTEWLKDTAHTVHTQTIAVDGSPPGCSSITRARILEGDNGDGFTEENDKVLLVGDEVDPRRINYDQINNLCTSSHLTVRCLYEEPRHVANVTRLIMTSNFRPEGACKGNQILHVRTMCAMSNSSRSF